MILLEDLIDRYRSDLEYHHSHELLPGHYRALQAMRRCRNQHSRVMILHCNSCHHQSTVPHSCGHRSCPHCQQHDCQQWLERQKAELLLIDYYMVTFTMPAQLRRFFWVHQRIAYDLVLKTAWQTNLALHAAIHNCVAAAVPMLYSTPMNAILTITRMCM